MIWSTTKINNESHYQKSDNGDDLDAGENKFGFTIDSNGEDVQADNQDDDEGDPGGDIDVISTAPELNHDGGSGDFRAQGDG